MTGDRIQGVSGYRIAKLKKRGGLTAVCIFGGRGTAARGCGV